MRMFRYVFLLSEPSYPLRGPAGGDGEGYLWVKTLGPPGQLLLLFLEDPLPQVLESCQHTITNPLDEEKRIKCIGCHAGDISITLVESQCTFGEQ